MTRNPQNHSRVKRRMNMDSGKLIIRMPYILCLFALCMLSAIPAHAQTTSLSGTVTDAAGAAAPGASLTLTGTSGAERTAISNEVGFYRFVQLVPGKYTLRTELKGFKATKQTLDLLVDTPMTLDIRLEVGEISETVTVEAEASMLNTQDAALGNAFEGLRIRQLPLQDRNAANLSDPPAGRHARRICERRAERPDQSHPGRHRHQRSTNRRLDKLRCCECRPIRFRNSN